MRLSELAEREDAERLLCETLAQGWSRQTGRPVSVRPGSDGEQTWRFQPLISAAFCGPNKAARRYMADSFRYTAVRRRIVPQWIMGTGIASRPGLLVTGRPLFSVTPALPRAHELLVIPGNQRHRIHDFGTGTSHVWLKPGFDRASVDREVAVRGPGKAGPFLSITRHGDGWYEEPLVAGFALARCPPWRPRARYEAEALTALEGFQETTAAQADRAPYVAGRVAEITARATELEARFGATEPLVQWAELLAAHTAGEHVDLSLSHGDLQPGNILVERPSDRVMLIDWEMADTRSRAYDRTVLKTAMRSPAGLAGRVGHLTPELAMVLLEELSRLLMESLSGPYRETSPGYALFTSELAKILKESD